LTSLLDICEGSQLFDTEELRKITLLEEKLAESRTNNQELIQLHQTKKEEERFWITAICDKLKSEEG